MINMMALWFKNQTAAVLILPMILLATVCTGFSSLRPRRAAKHLLHASSQVLEFTEPTTGVKVKLVGAMHYNPASIQLAADTINEAAKNDELGSVLIESCPIRWNTTNEMNPLLSSILQSEMRIAHDLAMEYKRPVVLGDQLINVTGDRLGNGLKETLKDLMSPITGWKAIAGNLTQARQEAAPLGPEYLGLFAFFEPKLLLAAPISLIKYPLSYFIKAPLASVALFALLFWTDSSSAAATTTVDEPVVTATVVVANLLGSALETVFFARIFLKELLADRNAVLARNILDQCRYYETQQATTPAAFWKSGWLGSLLLRRSSSNTATVYAKGSVRPRYESSSEKCVVAVLGLAHCNGIAKLLQEERVS